MNPTEELKYLVDLLKEASNWRVSEGDDRDPLRMEVEQRIDKLLGATPVVVDGREQSVSKPTTDSPKDVWTHERVRVRFSDGKQHWAKREHCKKVQRTDRPNLWKWELLPEFEKEYNFNQNEESDDGRTETT